MSKSKTTNSAPVFYFNGYSIETSYSFSKYNTSKGTKTNKVWLDMVFIHPIKEQAVTVRAAKSALILSQPKEVIEAIAQRDVIDFLSFSGLSFNAISNVTKAIAV